MVCDWCGHDVGADIRFCGACGHDVDGGIDRRWEELGGSAGGQLGPGLPARAEPANGFSVAGIVCGGLTLLTTALALGVIGILLSAIGIARNERLASLAMVVAFVGLVVGIVLAAMRITGFVPSL